MSVSIRLYAIKTTAAAMTLAVEYAAIQNVSSPYDALVGVAATAALCAAVAVGEYLLPPTRQSPLQ